MIEYYCRDCDFGEPVTDSTPLSCPSCGSLRTVKGSPLEKFRYFTGGLEALFSMLCGSVLWILIAFVVLLCAYNVQSILNWLLL